MARAGATWPDDARGLRQILADSPFLVPGFGAQGAGPEKALAGLTYTDDGWQGGLVNSTRGLIFPKEAADGIRGMTLRADKKVTKTPANDE